MLYSIPWLQRTLANGLFGYRPQNDKLKQKFADGGFPGFYERSKTDPEYSTAFAGCKASERSDITTVMTATGTKLALDVVSIEPEVLPDGHQPLNIVTFQGLFAYYESYDCFTTYSKIAKDHNARVHAFNYPGIHRSQPADKTDTVREFNDLVNCGIAIVNKLLSERVHPDKIVLQGNCIGAAASAAVQNEFMKKGIKLRLVAGNTFASFKGVAKSFATQEGSNPWLHAFLKFFFDFILVAPLRKYLIKKTGWDASITRTLKSTDPYHMVMQREQDLAFREGKLQSKLAKYKAEREQAANGTSDIKDRPDQCPEAYKAARDRLDAKAILKPKENERSKVAIFNNAEHKIAKLLRGTIDKAEMKKFIIISISKFIDDPTNYDAFMLAKHISPANIAEIKALMQAADTHENRAKVDSHPLGIYQLEGFHELLAEYLEASDEYIANIPELQRQKQPTRADLPGFLHTAVQQPSWLHVIIEGLFYSLFPIAVLGLIANPLVLPFVLGLFGVGAVSYGLIYAIAVPVLMVLAIIFAADLWGDEYGPKVPPADSKEVNAVIDNRVDEELGTSPSRSRSVTPLRDLSHGRSFNPAADAHESPLTQLERALAAGTFPDAVPAVPAAPAPF